MLDNIRLLKAGQTGFGYLIEQDAGYISPNDSRNLPAINELKNLDVKNGIISDPLIVYVILQKYGVKNRNGRVYSEEILKKQNEVYQQLIKERRAVGELDHPESSIIAGDRISHNIIETWWEGKTLMGKMEILMTKGYVNYGIVSTKGDHAAELLRHKITIGVSSRGVGSVEEINGIQLVQNDFELICWDIVTNPSTPGSWVFNNTAEASRYTESYKTPNKSSLLEGLDNFLLD